MQDFRNTMAGLDHRLMLIRRNTNHNKIDIISIQNYEQGLENLALSLMPKASRTRTSTGTFCPYSRRASKASGKVPNESRTNRR